MTAPPIPPKNSLYPPHTRKAIPFLQGMLGTAAPNQHPEEISCFLRQHPLVPSDFPEAKETEYQTLYRDEKGYERVAAQWGKGVHIFHSRTLFFQSFHNHRWIPADR